MNGAFRQSMTWLHTWSGIVVVWLLYFMFVTGTVGYFDDEIDLWMQPEVPASEQPSLDLAVPALQRRLETEYAEADRWFLYPTVGRSNPHTGIFYQMPEVEGAELERGREDLDVRTGAPFAEARDTGGGQVLYRMHYLLHYLPGQSGYYIMAIVTMFMFVGLMTGVVAHKKIFKDFFTFRWARGQRSWLDLHNLASVASLPFQFMITYSGLLFTLGLFWMPFVVLGGYGFDIERIQALAADFQGEQVQRSGTTTPQTPLLELAQRAEAEWGPNQISFIRVDFPGDANSRVTVGRAGVGRAGRSSLMFDGVTGEQVTADEDFFLNNNSAFGFASVMLTLHEGTFANYVLRWIYFFSGLLGTLMIATGAIYWIEKRRPKDPDDPGKFSFRAVERANVATIAGLIAAVGVYLWANRLLPVGMEGRAGWEVHCMFLAWLALFLHAAVRPVRAAWFEQSIVVAVVFLGLPLVNLLTTDVHLLRTVPAGDWRLAGVDLTAISTGIAALLAARALRPVRADDGVEAQAIETPADLLPQPGAGG
ncbi:MAG: PepSY-associated TM helix domain-containing protein [Pseudomonadota bacterium]